MEDPERYLLELEIDVPCAVAPGKNGIVDAAHRSVVNWEIYYFSSKDEKKLFDSDPARYCGLLTDPVSRARFRPAASSPRLEHAGRPYFFADRSTAGSFRSNPEAFARPDPKMKM